MATDPSGGAVDPVRQTIDNLYPFGQGTPNINTLPPAGAIPRRFGDLGVKKLSARRTWTEKTGYSFSEFYEGHHSAINLAFQNPNIICGANHVVADRNYGSEKATMNVTFGHRTKEEAIANFAQPEEFKSFWSFEPQLVRMEMWRHPVYFNILNDQPYASGVTYPLARQIWLAVQQFLRAWE